MKKVDPVAAKFEEITISLLNDYATKQEEERKAVEPQEPA